jgi:hypothetical protein
MWETTVTLREVGIWLLLVTAGWQRPGDVEQPIIPRHADQAARPAGRRVGLYLGLRRNLFSRHSCAQCD